MKYVCSFCGHEGAIPCLARPAVDDRFAVGLCGKCQAKTVFDRSAFRDERGMPPHAEEDTHRDLVRADAWKPEMLSERRRKKRERSDIAAHDTSRRRKQPPAEATLKRGAKALAQLGLAEDPE